MNTDYCVLNYLKGYIIICVEHYTSYFLVVLRTLTNILLKRTVIQYLLCYEELFVVHVHGEKDVSFTPLCVSVRASMC